MTSTSEISSFRMAPPPAAFYEQEGPISQSNYAALLKTLCIKGLREPVTIYRLTAWLGEIPPIGVSKAPSEPVGKLIRDPAIASGPLTLSALHQLPPPPRDFTGREDELLELLAAVEAGGVTISGLQGMGGIGKTALALVLAARLTERYPDARIYLDLKGAGPLPLTAAEAMQHVIRAYVPEAKLPEKESELRGFYQSVLHSQRAILLMDNARDAAQVEPLIPPATCILLVTSRQHFTLPGLHAKNLEALPPADARALLLTIEPRIGAEAEAMAKLCGYLPLALRLASSALAERMDLSPQDYARRLTGAQERLKLVDASLALSYDLLSPELQRQFRALAVFPETFDVDGAVAVWATEHDAAHDALSTLVRYSLLIWVEESKRYSLHDLVQDFAKSKRSDPEKAQDERRHAEHYLAISSAADNLHLKGGDAFLEGLRLFDTEWGNIRAGQAWATAHAAQDDAAARSASSYPSAGAYCLALRQHPRERILWLEAALAAARRLKDRAAEEAHLGNQGMAYANLGETRRAIEFYEQQLVIVREIGDRRGEGNALGNLGNAYADLGEPRRAIKFYEQNLVIAREIGDRRGEGNTLGNLGIAYANLGEPRRAIEFYEQRLVIAREIGDRRGEGSALGNLGNAYSDLGETRRAIGFGEQHLAVAREIGDRRGEGNALGNLGLAHANLGETRRAIEFYEQQLVIAREIGDRRGEGNAVGNLGNACLVLGETRRAIELYEQRLIIAREIGDRRGEGSALGNLGNACLVLGETRRAIESYEKALAIDREIGDRRGEGNALWNMSLALDQLGNRAQAIVHAEAALEIHEAIEDPNAAKVRAALAQWRGQA
jgi:tetratricopeptide (TPR) repeat protein